MTEPHVPTRNIYEIRQNRLMTAWTEEFNRMRRRERIPFILLAAILGLQVLQFLI